MKDIQSKLGLQQLALDRIDGIESLERLSVSVAETHIGLQRVFFKLDSQSDDYPSIVESLNNLNGKLDEVLDKQTDMDIELSIKELKGKLDTVRANQETFKDIAKTSSK